ncbi:uncharacterized protein LOC120208912 [Hibiscus syriacus]|uniref:uncharacterized protein LOC120208912 n=1 Tax=Hibiscus syriacus TaxID=106335 RepID=UPI00192213A0|nr:uncharacterized protein LOC120208912 [Hibiscus syriacus]
MADVLDDGEFWLPPQFLTADDEVKTTTNTKNLKDGEGLFPYEFIGGFGSFGFSSDLSSPVESVLGSTKTESDGEDYLAVLTRQMAHSTVIDDSLRIDPTDDSCPVRRNRPYVRYRAFVVGSKGLAVGVQAVNLGFHHRRQHGTSSPKPSTKLDASVFYPQQSLYHNKLRTTRFQQLKQDQLMKQQDSLGVGRIEAAVEASSPKQRKVW